MWLPLCFLLYLALPGSNPPFLTEGSSAASSEFSASQLLGEESLLSSRGALYYFFQGPVSLVMVGLPLPSNYTLSNQKVQRMSGKCRPD